MKTFMRTLSTLSAALVLAAPVWAATHTVTLAVPGMTCPTCPITVKKALVKVSGVSKVDVSFEKRHAVVIYDEAKTNVDSLIKATTDAGYPSRLETSSNR